MALYGRYNYFWLTAITPALPGPTTSATFAVHPPRPPPGIAIAAMRRALLAPIVAPVVALAVAVAATAAWWAWAGRPVALVDAPGDRFPCLSYAPFQGRQTPFDADLVIPRAQIAADLRLLAAHTGCIRTYSTQLGLAEVVPIAAELGLQVMLGVWIGNRPDESRRDLEAGVGLANRYPATVRALIVGNEVLLRGEYSPDGLRRLLADVRARVSVPVTYADVWEFWEKYPALAEAVDFVTIHTLPYWENEPLPVADAVPHVIATTRRMASAFAGKPVFIGEAGWPSAGRMREGALPSPVSQARFIRELAVAAAADGIGLNIIEAFDQPWKRRSEGTVGGHWGVFNEARHLKFPLTGPVSDHPHWRQRFAVAAGLGAALLALALPAAAGLAAGLGWGAWLLLALATQAAGTALVLAWEHAIDASHSPLLAAIWGGRWLLALAAAALFVPAAARLFAGRPLPVPGIAQLLARRPPAPGRLPLALGVVRATVLFTAATAMVCFVFDSRYRDFPIAAYGVPALAFLLLAIIDRRRRPPGRPPAGDLAEERLLAHVLVAGGLMSLVIVEGYRNWQALSWSAVAMALALAVYLADGGRASRSATSSTAAADSSGDHSSTPAAPSAAAVPKAAGPPRQTA